MIWSNDGMLLDAHGAMIRDGSVCEISADWISGAEATKENRAIC
jgi:hypothetical protein